MTIHVVEKESLIKSVRIVVKGLVAVLNRVVRVGIIKKVTFEQRNKREGDTRIQGKGIASANALSTDCYGVVCVTGPVKQSARRGGSRSNVEPRVLNVGSEDRI